MKNVPVDASVNGNHGVRMPDDGSMLEERILSYLRREGDDEEAFGKLMLEVFRFQREQNAAYGNYCREFGEPQMWREIPAVPQSAFKHFALRSFPEGETLRTFRTSGTTGEGYGEHHFRDLALYKAAALAGWKRAGLPSVVDIALLPSPEEAPHSSLSCMAEWVVKPGAYFIRGGKLQAEALFRRLEETREAVTIFGTALAFLNYFEWLKAEKRRHTLPEGCIVVETGGYKGSGRDIKKETLYGMFETNLGLKVETIFNEYGMTEMSSQFYSRGIGAAHRGGPWVRAVVIDPASGKEVAEGERGVLKIYDLANVGSVCGILTQDLAVRRKEGFELLERDPGALPRGCSRGADEGMRGKVL